MEKDIKLGSIADIDFSFAGGKASVKLSAGYEAADLGVSVKSENSASVDSLALVDKLFAAIEKASPAGAVPIEETVKALIKAAVAAIA